MMPHPDPRTVRRALGVLERLPHEALADLTERLIDRLDGAEPEPDLEPEVDCCTAGEDGGLPMPGDRSPGDADDAEPDDADRGTGEDEPDFRTLRAERDGFVTVERRPVVTVLYRGGRPVRVQTVRWERRA